MTDEIDQSQASIIEHLTELRQRLLNSFIALILSFFVCYYFAEDIFVFLARPLVEAGGGKLIYTKLYEAFFVNIKVAFYAAIFASFPIFANQVWLFIAPGLYKREKQFILPVLIVTPCLFIMGSALAYYIVMPQAFRFFLSFQTSATGQMAQYVSEALPKIDDYFTLVVHMIFAFGLSFLTPILLIILERVGFVKLKTLRGGRRYAILISFIIAAVITPPDIPSQVMLAILLILLYELSIIAIRILNRLKKHE